MAKQKRKQAPAKPITSHQLFPAVVALWFGALFGLGSLAVRPSLLESLVIASRIDLLVPAAAPPLGITARILVALILAAIGASIGIAIARRLARPKQEHRERKRSAGSISTEDSKHRYGGHYADAPARPPISINDELDGDEPSLSSGILAPRRRSLAIEHEEADFVPHDMAPLPGGPPQVLDIGEVRLSAEATEAPLDLGAYAPAAEPSAAQAPLDWANAAPVQAAPGFEPQPPRQIFEPQVFQPAPEAVAPLAAPAAYISGPDHAAAEANAAAADGRQVFGMAPQEPPSEATRQIFGQAVAGDHISQDFLREAGYKTTVFDVEESSPLFVPREMRAAASAAPQDYAVPPAPEIRAYHVPEAYVPPSELDAPTDAPEAPFAAPQFAAPIAAELVVQPAAQAAPQPSPAGLGMTDLASRLAESMARRRAARTSEPVEAGPAMATVPVAAPAFDLAAPASFAADPAPAAQFDALPTLPAAFAPPVSMATESAPFAAPIPTEFTPAPIPQAMRPLDLDGFEEDDAPLDSFLPPRMLATPAAQHEAPQAPVPQSFAAPTDEAEIANEGVAEASYASLLAVAAPAAPPTSFVRIDEPEAEFAATEPVVIFPGQMVRPAAVPCDDEAGSFRRFDAPASAGQGQPIGANQPASGVDPEEAQRALRSALANLQRMSGAA